MQERPFDTPPAPHPPSLSTVLLNIQIAAVDEVIDSLI